MLIYSIVQNVEYGSKSSYPAGRWEVCHSGDEMTARDICATFNRCRSSDNLGFSYSVEPIDEESPNRAHEKPRRVDTVCVPNCRFV
jgi:ribulose bisphosphate carboxylase small subunit